MFQPSARSDKKRRDQEWKAFARMFQPSARSDKKRRTIDLYFRSPSRTFGSLIFPPSNLPMQLSCVLLCLLLGFIQRSAPPLCVVLHRLVLTSWIDSVLSPSSLCSTILRGVASSFAYFLDLSGNHLLSLVDDSPRNPASNQVPSQFLRYVVAVNISFLRHYHFSICPQEQRRDVENCLIRLLVFSFRKFRLLQGSYLYFLQKILISLPSYGERTSWRHPSAGGHSAMSTMTASIARGSSR